MKNDVQQALLTALRNLEGEGRPFAAPVDPAIIVLERTRDPAHGDLATNVAMRLAKQAGRPPRELAQAIVAALPATAAIARAEVAGAGFINFFLARDVGVRELARVHELGAAYGRAKAGSGEKILVEFVSANPTGPLHVAHGRHAAYGSALANLLEAAGHAVSREFYVNDAGRQVDIFAVSVWLRYLERLGESVAFPSGGYKGDYLRPIAARLEAEVGRDYLRAGASLQDGLPPDADAGGDADRRLDAVIERAKTLLGAGAWQRLLESSLEGMLADIREDLADIGVTYDRWYSERTLATSGALERALERLRANGHLYEKDGAIWFRATAFGDDEDRVVVRANGAKTYFASDIAYHLDKRRRGFERLIDVLGADHHGYVARVRGGLAAMGEPPESLEVALIQIVSLFRNGQKVAMGKREGQFVTFRELRTEVGNDAARFFFVMRSHEQSLDFDLELAKSRSNENPVYYVQYAHARVASVLKELAARGHGWSPEAGRAAALADQGAELAGEQAQALLTALVKYPEVIAQAAARRAPHALVQYLRELAHALHTFYNAERVLVPEQRARDARVFLLTGVQQVLRNGLAILGVSAPESM